MCVCVWSFDVCCARATHFTSSVACLFAMETERTAFVTTLQRFACSQNQHTPLQAKVRVCARERVRVDAIGV
jgi:hypothetical protein